NARDAMHQGGEITFETCDIELDENTCRQSPYTITPGKYFKVSVSDTGIGMEKETLKHIFEPFFTTKPVGRGTGMGLPAVYGTVKKSMAPSMLSASPVMAQHSRCCFL
ncbi:MAG: hypothetical protein HGB19_05350, partial [Chlorobiales bacterium]|nr:hypothetical protein [Chlorobiales bacterium]